MHRVLSDFETDEQRKLQEWVSSVEKESGWNVTLAEDPFIRRAVAAESAAALLKTPLTIVLLHPSGNRGEFVAAYLKHVESGQVLSEGAFLLTDRYLMDDLRAWALVALKGRTECALDVSQLVSRLGREDRCDEALTVWRALGAGDQPPLEVTKKCNQIDAQSRMASADAGSMLGLKFETVPDRYRNVFADLADGSPLQQQVSQFFPRTPELAIKCADDCLQIRLRLTLHTDQLPATSEEDKASLGGVAKALIQYRDELRRQVGTQTPKVIERPPTELILQSSSGGKLSIDVDGTTSNAKLTRKP